MPSAPPSLSIVVASTGRPDRLLANLVAVAPQCVRDEIELIVAHGGGDAELTAVMDALPNAHVIAAPLPTDIDALRNLGFAAATGDVVALLDHTDTHAISLERWVHELRRRCSLHRNGPPLSESSADVGAPLRHPYLSVVVPVHQGADLLPRSLAALAGSELPRSLWELIVVDDASTDETARIAARFADVVVRLAGKPHGTAYARNRGFEWSRGECVAFVNAGVCVRPDTLTRFTLVLAREPEVGAVFGTFEPPAATESLVSQYRNLRLQYWRQDCEDAAETFCASCGAVRSRAFATVGMFDEWHFPRHQIEDFDLGHRLRQHGHRIVMRRDIQAAHLKRWTLRGMIAAELHDRAVPWMRLFDRRAVTRVRARCHVRRTKAINTALTWLALAFTAAAVHLEWPLLLLATAICTGVVLRNYAPQHRFFVRERGVAFALAVLPLELLFYLVNGVALAVGWTLRELLGEPRPAPRIEAFAEVGLRTWPPVPARRSDPVAQQSTETLGRPA